MLKLFLYRDQFYTETFLLKCTAPFVMCQFKLAYLNSFILRFVETITHDKSVQCLLSQGNIGLHF